MRFWGYGRGVCLALLVLVLCAGVSYADNASTVLDDVEDYFRPFVEISSIECSSTTTVYKYSSNGVNEWDAVDLNDNTLFSMRLENDVGLIEYKNSGIIPVVNSREIEGISLYVKKRYTSIFTVDENGSVSGIQYRYENDTIVNGTMMLNLSAFTQSSTFNLSMNNIPVYTDIYNSTNSTGFIVSVDNLTDCIDISCKNNITREIINGIEVFNKSIVTPDRKIDLPTGGNLLFSFINNQSFAGTKEADVINDSIQISNSNNYSFVDSRIQGIVVLKDSYPTADSIVVDDNASTMESLQFIGKIPIIEMEKGGVKYKAIPIFHRTDDRYFNGNNIVGGIPLLSIKFALKNITAPKSLKARCEIVFAENQVLKGIKIIPANQMSINRILINGEVKFSGNKELAEKNKTTLYYDTPAFGNIVEIEMNANTSMCTASEIAEKCTEKCGGTFFMSGIFGRSKCFEECQKMMCYKSEFGFYEISNKLPELKASVDYIERDPFLLSYSQFMPGESVRLFGSIGRDDHRCGAGARRWCHDTLITQCEESTTCESASLTECHSWQPRCPGGWTLTASACHGKVCQLSIVGQILLGALTGWIFGGMTFWTALLKSAATVILTEVLHLPSWLANLIVGTLQANGWNFNSLFNTKFLINVVVEYGKSAAYQMLIKGLSNGGFLEHLLGIVLNKAINLVGNSITDPVLQQSFFSGTWFSLNNQIITDMIKQSVVEALTYELISKSIKDPWIAQFASVYLSKQITNMAYVEKERIKKVENEIDILRRREILNNDDKQKLQELNIQLRTLKISSGDIEYGFRKGIENAELTSIVDIVAQYLQNKVLEAGADGNSVTCEREYIADPQFRPHTLQIQDCPTIGTISMPAFKTQTNEDILYSQGYYLCNGKFRKVENITVVLRIRDSAGNVVREYINSTRDDAIMTGSNFLIKIEMPEIPGRYMMEIYSEEYYENQSIIANYKQAIDVVSPNIVLKLTPKDQCGSGEQLDYQLEINSSVNYPVIMMQGDVWTPFSLPYIPKKKSGYRDIIDNITLKELGPRCEFIGLQIWNQEQKIFELIDVDASIIPGQGYFAKASNTCIISFRSERFFNEFKQIQFENLIGSSEQGYFALIGSTGNIQNIDDLRRRCPELGYSIEDGFAVPNNNNKALYAIEALSPSAPFALKPNVSCIDRCPVNFVDSIQPGKAYWIYTTNSSECTFFKADTSPPFTGKDIGLNTTFYLPDGWEVYNQMDYLDFLNRISIGTLSYREYDIIPNTSDYNSYRLYPFALNLFNQTIFVNRTVNGSYSIIKSDPDISTTEIASERKKIYMINVTNNDNEYCQNRIYYLKLQAPDLWNGAITKNFLNITPGSSNNFIVSMNPRSSSHDINILITSSKKDASSYEDIFESYALIYSSSFIAYNSTVYFADDQEGIGIIINNTINYPGVIYNKRFGSIGVIARNSRYLFYTEQKSNTYIAKMDNNYSTSYIINISSLDVPITADENYVYFFDNALYRVGIEDGIVERLIDAKGTAITVDDQYIYWIDENTIKRMQKTGGAVAEIADFSEKVSNIDSDNSYVYAAIDDDVYGRIAKIDKSSLSLSTVAGFSDAKSISMDGRWLYVSNGFNIGRIEKITNTYLQKIFVEVPGHNPPDINISDMEGVPGEVIEFPIRIRNNNYNSPESTLNFYIKDVSLDTNLERTYDGYRCYDESRFIGNNRTGVIYVCINSTIASTFNSSYEFSVTIGSDDPLLDRTVSARYIIRSPGAPFVRVIGDKRSDIFDENVATISPGEDAWYDIEITNTENSTSIFGFNISDAGYEVYDKYRENIIDSIFLGYRTYDRKETVSLKLKTKNEYGSYNKTLRVFNIQHLDIYKDVVLGVMATSCNYNNVCNTENNENSTNCEDCTADIKCLYGEECDRTSARGVDFGVLADRLDKFAVCRRGVSDYKCMLEADKGCIGELDNKACFCYGDNTINSATCSINCIDNNAYYYMLGLQNETFLRSSSFLFNCPTCLGNSYYEFQSWIADKKEKHMTADCCLNQGRCGGVCTTPSVSRSCLDNLAFIIESAKALEEDAKNVQNSMSGCPETIERLISFMQDMDKIYEEKCSQYLGYGNLKIVYMDKNNVTVENNGSVDYYAFARCSYTKDKTITAISECKKIVKNTKAVFNMNPAIDYGLWNIECHANGSLFEDCRASSKHDSLRKSVNIPYPNTSLEVIKYSADADYSQARISVTARNNGADGNGDIRCSLQSGTDKKEISGNGMFVPFNKTVVFRLISTMDSGLWTIKNCSVYHQNKIQHTLEEDYSFIMGSPCSDECRSKGYDYGISSQNICKLEQIKDCCCGRIEKLKKCGNENIFTVNWVEGDYLNMNGNRYYSNASISTAKESLSISMELFHNSSIVYKDKETMECLKLPYIKIVSPKNNSIVNDNISIELSKDSYAFIYDNNEYIGELDNRTAKLMIDTTKIEDGKHTIMALSCNSAGCSNDSIVMHVNNAIKDYAFYIIPEYRSYKVAQESELKIIFIIKNIGKNSDRYGISYSMNPDWVKSIDTELYVNSMEEAVINATIVTTNISTALELGVYSYGSTELKKAIINFSIGYPNTPPEILYVNAVPDEVSKGSVITFYSDIRDNDTINARMCEDRSCNRLLCTLELREVLGKQIYQCSYLVDIVKGVHNYYLIAEDGKDISIAYGGMFYVLDFVEQNYDFTIDPYEQHTTSMAEQVQYLEFYLKNTGSTKDIYDIEANAGKWYASFTIDGIKRSFITLYPNQSAIIRAGIDATGEIGDKDKITLSIYSRASKYSKKAYAYIAVNSIADKAPQILDVYANPVTAIKGDVITFHALIDDADYSAVVCNDRNCTTKYCEIDNSSCVYKTTAVGTYEYYVVAESNGLTSISYAKRFFVKDSNATQTIVMDDINSSSYVSNDNPENAIDNNNKTYWTARRLPAWIVADLNSQKTINGFGIFSESPARPSAFSIRVSKDCSNYLDVYSTNSTSYKSGWIKDFFNPASGRCIMLYVTKSESGADYTSLATFEVYTTNASVKNESVVQNNTVISCPQGYLLINNTCIIITTEHEDNYNLAWIAIAIIICAAIIIFLFKSKLINKLRLWKVYKEA